MTKGEIRNLEQIARLDADACKKQLFVFITEEKAKQEAKAIKTGKKIEVVLHLADGEVKKVLAEPIGKYFCIHRSLSNSGWTVTHIPTGMTAGTASVKRLAKAKVSALRRLDIPWEKFNPLSDVSEENRSKACRIATSESEAKILEIL